MNQLLLWIIRNNRTITTKCSLQYVLPKYHPCLNIYHNNEASKEILPQIKLDENFDTLLLLKHFGIYNFVNQLNNRKHRFNIEGEKYLHQPQWYWGRNDKLKQYDPETCVEIQQAYQQQSEFVVFTKGMYSKGVYHKLQKFVWCQLLRLKCKQSISNIFISKMFTMGQNRETCNDSHKRIKNLCDYVEYCCTFAGHCNVQLFML